MVVAGSPRRRSQKRIQLGGRGLLGAGETCGAAGASI